MTIASFRITPGANRIFPQALAAAVLLLAVDSEISALEKHLAVVPTSTSPVIDGRLTDPGWAGVPVATGFVRINRSTLTEPTTARMVYDGEAIYIAVECREGSPDDLTITASDNDVSEIFADDNVEIFIDTNNDRATYYHFAINAAGAHYQAYCDLRDGNAIRDETWNPPIDVAAHIGADRWSVEIRVPLAALRVTKPSPGTAWAVNFCRSWRSTSVSDGEFSMWSPAEAFNRPDAFGLAIFGMAPGSEALARALREARASPRGAANQGPKIDVELDRFYYTPDVATVQVRLETDATAGHAAAVTIRKDAHTPPVARQSVDIVEDKASYDLSFAMTPWPHGRYVVSVDLRDADAALIRSSHHVFIKRRLDPAPPSPSALNATIRDDGVILVGGKPFLPFVGEGWSPASPLAKESFSLTTYGDLGTLAIAHPLEWPRLNLPWVTRTPEETFILMPDEEAMYAKLREEVGARKSDGTVLARMLKYEAQLPMYRGTVENRTPLDNPEECRRINAFVKEVAPHHLTSIHVDRPKYVERFRDVADIMEVGLWTSSYAPSLIPNLRRDMEWVRRIVGPNKPIKFWIGSTIPSPDKRTAEEIRCACYLVLTRGGAAIGFNMGHGGLDLTYTRHWSVYPGLYRELTDLFDILTTIQQRPIPTVAVDSPDIDLTIRWKGDRLYIVAINTSRHTVGATFTMDAKARPDATIGLPFEQRQVPVDDHRFTDQFAAFEPHMYELTFSP